MTTAFPEWGYSHNALYVPLSGGWHCALMPAHEVREVDRSWRLPYEERKQKRKEQKEQIERDRQDFDRLFDVRIDRRGARACSEFREYIDFLEQTLRISSWDRPVDGEALTRILRSAVRNGHLIPVIARKWHGGQCAFRHYAPQRWPTKRSGSQATSEVLNWREFATLRRANGESGFGVHLLDSDADANANIRSRVSGSDGAGFDLPVLLEIAGAALDGSSERDNDASMFKRLSSADGAGTGLDEAQPFEYQPDMPDDDVFDLASQKTKTPNSGDPGIWYTNPGSGQMRLYGDTGAPVIDLDFDHRHNGMIPHAHNWNDGARDTDDDVVPFSPWNP